TPASGFIGNDTFTYTIRDMSGSLSNTAQVTIVVVPVNDPPVAVDDGRIVLNNGLPLTIDVLSNDSDPDNTINELTITSVTTPTFGSVNIENGTIVYQSSGDESGTVTFTYTIEDPQGLTSTAMVTIQYEYVPLRVSEGFSPNNDGNNDTWFIQSIESHPNNAIKVFDRWGLLVYQAKNYDNNSVLWDGRANAGQQSGNYLDQGTYYYVIDLGNKSSEFSGYVVIVR
ncbi:MAG TPA: gliding motility-associated C-terminal domain-containing protein, partial [Cyclobacteriaceae bacterium]|nr:gliding motility-associated C-terminal domain-containing protein [Cyclobacteriaceae bacterium]